ncbi:MAG: YggS family pyridoxal phosphate-dependent enzyme [Calditrichaeota bacterium]|nr:MAG: YggS family pyridoxal phosphate-dependent enzyme [Calditrichota bacterium]
MVDLKKNITEVKNRIARAAERCGRSPQEITLVAVTKTIPVERINEAIQLGIQHIGENRIQEAREKLPKIQDNVTRHFVGHLQRNKVKYAIKLFDMIQSVDSLALAEEINQRCVNSGKKMPVLIEVNTSGESSKYGCEPQETLTLLQAIDRLPALSVQGFMTVALYSEDLERVRPCFKLLKSLFDEAQNLPLKNADIKILSMGMSSDFEIAIEEGSTMVRIGTAIFGPREYAEIK